MNDLHDEEPFKKGSLKDIAGNRSKRPRFIRTPVDTDAKVIDELCADLVLIFASVGIQLSNIREIARALVKCGWTKTKKVL